MASNSRVVRGQVWSVRHLWLSVMTELWWKLKRATVTNPTLVMYSPKSWEETQGSKPAKKLLQCRQFMTRKRLNCFNKLNCDTSPAKTAFALPHYSCCTSMSSHCCTSISSHCCTSMSSHCCTSTSSHCCTSTSSHCYTSMSSHSWTVSVRNISPNAILKGWHWPGWPVVRYGSRRLLLAWRRWQWNW